MATSLNDTAYAHICRLLMENRIHPNQRLSEQHIAKELGISRTPVREAIRRLRGEGILQQIPSSGTYLLPTNGDNVQEIYEIREALECFLVKKAVPLMTNRDFKQIRERYVEMKKAVDEMQASEAPFLTGEPLSRFLKSDWAFHRLLVEPADNHQALKVLDDIQLRGCVFGVHSHRRNIEHLSRVLYLHRHVAKAVSRGSAISAAHWLRMHIRESRRDALAAIRENEISSGKSTEQQSAYNVIMKKDLS